MLSLFGAHIYIRMFSVISIRSSHALSPSSTKAGNIFRHPQCDKHPSSYHLILIMDLNRTRRSSSSTKSRFLGEDSKSAHSCRTLKLKQPALTFFSAKNGSSSARGGRERVRNSFSRACSTASMSIFCCLTESIREKPHENQTSPLKVWKDTEEMDLGFYGVAVGVRWIHRQERRRAHEKEVVSQACNLSVEMTKPTKEPERLGSQVADDLSDPCEVAGTVQS